MPNTCMRRKEICFDLVFGTALKDLEVEYLVTQLNGKWCRNYIFRGNDADLTDCLPVPQLVLGSFPKSLMFTQQKRMGDILPRT